MSEKTATKKLFKRDNLMRYISVACIIVLAFVFEQIQSNFLGRMNIVSMLRDNAVLLTLAVGMTSVLIFGSIDLSMGAMCSVSNVLYVRIIVMFGEKYKAAGVEDRVGSIAVGKDADIVVFTGHPFHYLTKTSAVFINGKRED
jgi:ribose/xylose/arabinose/galactoside ABC-type transport system permease subunit